MNIGRINQINQKNENGRFLSLRIRISTFSFISRDQIVYLPPQIFNRQEGKSFQNWGENSGIPDFPGKLIGQKDEPQQNLLNSTLILRDK
jgi:hypothetical protein